MFCLKCFSPGWALLVHFSTTGSSQAIVFTRILSSCAQYQNVLMLVARGFLCQHVMHVSAHIGVISLVYCVSPQETFNWIRALATCGLRNYFVDSIFEMGGSLTGTFFLFLPCLPSFHHGKDTGFEASSKYLNCMGLSGSSCIWCVDIVRLFLPCYPLSDH